ncbi:MAG TPA: zinc metalloprotease HtpX [Caldisericia bacterium]|jgi:heat shock protein HtpX|nr:zinc metalloprotease HtpX [Caldisericia bacterium]HPB33710.1 zinc metalloprotease HtpX [Caldisericia bacterium]HQL66392.1 zinc metalloprotease HtpX [Caldisericia bacterium]HQN47863.1 zinc metalloprotease HtpX [Caldisericia bacterium]HQO99447.1 zinc metalloprotease HtpX [Caldisericia bacterium]
MKKTLYELISENKRKTFLFLIIFSIILFLIGYVIAYLLEWGITGIILIAVILIIYNLITYYNSDKIALMSVGARPAKEDEFQVLHNVVEEVSIAAGIPKPKVYVMYEVQPNAFATGRNPQNASICVTTGLLQMMNRSELQGVVAHEMSHIKNYDILLMTVIGIVVGLIVLLRDILLRGMWFGAGRRDRDRSNSSAILMIIGLILAIISPILVALIRAAISRQREYLADADGAYIVRNPYGLASALEKIGGYSKPMKVASDATAHLFISSPFIGQKYFSTHPPIEDRIKRLKSLGF